MVLIYLSLITPQLDAVTGKTGNCLEALPERFPASYRTSSISPYDEVLVVHWTLEKVFRKTVQIFMLPTNSDGVLTGKIKLLLTTFSTEKLYNIYIYNTQRRPANDWRNKKPSSVGSTQ